MIVGSNKGVYLKDWQIRKVMNYDKGFEGYAVKLNRQYFKPYTFKSDFENFSFDKDEDFDELKKQAQSQNNTTYKEGWYGERGVDKYLI